MIDIVHAQRRHIADEHAGVERACIVDELGQHAVRVHEIGQPNHNVGQQRHTHQRARHRVGLVHADLLAPVFDGFAQAAAHVVYRVPQVELNLAQRFLDGIIGRLAQRHERNAHMIARIQLFIDDEAVHLRIIAQHAHIGRDEHPHMRDVDALFLLLADVARHLVKVELLARKNLRIAALGHDVGRQRDNGVYALHACSVGSSAEHISSILYSRVS